MSCPQEDAAVVAKRKSIKGGNADLACVGGRPSLPEHPRPSCHPARKARSAVRRVPRLAPAALGLAVVCFFFLFKLPLGLPLLRFVSSPPPAAGTSCTVPARQPCPPWMNTNTTAAVREGREQSTGVLRRTDGPSKDMTARPHLADPKRSTRAVYAFRKRKRFPYAAASLPPASEMVWLQYTATRSQRAATACLFLTGAALIVAAARLSYANVEPQRAKAAERRLVLEAFIRRKLGSDDTRPAASQQHDHDPPRKP
ncbi:hypothetical protein HU200_040216 [Digitaria exilis]|uniref:Transmembrane protein n=1 Tax=Digitaria exilis TaxID=1010633 RepID=A0A835BA01_9POAL|nr:hypothetical protein HU200_040216 [Digitaria exilis]